MIVVVTLVIAIGFLYVLWRPHWAAVLILVMFPLEQLIQAYIPAMVTRSWIANVAVALVAGFAVGMRILRGERVFRGFMNPVTISLAALYGLAWLSLLYTPSYDLAHSFLRGSWAYWVLMLILAPALVRDMSHFRDLMTGMMFAGTIIAALILINPNSSYYTGRLVLDLGRTSTGENLVGNPLAIAEMGALMAIASVLIRPVSAGQMLTVLRILAFTVGLGLAIGSGSRGQVLAGVGAGIACYPLAREVANPRHLFLVAGGLFVLAIGVVGVFKLFIGEENAERWSIMLMISDFSSRSANVWQFLGEWLASPGAWFAGLGANAFSSYGFDVGYVHNLPVEILCEEGVVGATLFVIAIVAVYRAGRDSMARWRGDMIGRSVVATLVSVCIFAFLLSLKQGALFGASSTFMYWVILAKLSRSEALDEAEADPEHDSLYDVEESYEYGAVTPAQ